MRGTIASRFDAFNTSLYERTELRAIVAAPRWISLEVPRVVIVNEWSFVVVEMEHVEMEHKSLQMIRVTGSRLVSH
jgi:hypothetical protein